jgi:Glyoxalase-like domain
MRVDHVSYAAEADGLRATAERLAKKLGVTPVDGGLHPRFGTRNIILPLAQERYVEVVAVLDHPASDKAPFGQAVRARSEAGGGWLGWVVEVEDLTEAEARLGREAVAGSRHRPDGVELRWRQLGIRGLIADPQLPYYIQWEDKSVHPSVGATTDVTISGLQIAGDRERVCTWLGVPADQTSTVLDFTFVDPNGAPRLKAVIFATPDGPVTI